MEWLKQIIEEVDTLRRKHEVPVNFQLSLYDLIAVVEAETKSHLSSLESKLREHRAYEINSTIHMTEINELDQRIKSLDPILEDRKNTLTQLNEIYEQNKNSRSSWEDTISKLKKEIEELRVEREELEKKAKSLHVSIDDDRIKAEKEYMTALDKMKNITAHFPLMHYLLTTTLENIPEAELLIIIGSNQPVDKDKIKSLVRNVPPVQIVRHLAKLEADDLIVNSDEGWRLEKSFYERILNQM